MPDSSPLPSSPPRQVALVATIVIVLLVLFGGAFLFFRPHYVVMFRDLKSQDAATIVAELDHEKTPYRLENDGSTILVPEQDVQSARLRVMSSDVPLKGTVGFELFNNSDLGFTEFAQKVNYQRALQGELARTVMGLEGVQSARVHLTIPESTLFNRSDNKAKASVTIVMKDDQVMTAEGSHGIQRLVASAVPGMLPADVTILDQHGASAGHGPGAEATFSDDPQLQMKMDLESYYSRKLIAAIEPIVGRDRVLVSVDATVNFDQVRTTEESTDARGANSVAARNDGKAAGKDIPLTAADNESSDIQLEGTKAPPVGPAATDHQHNLHKLEQIVAAPGSIRRLTVGLLLQTPLDGATQARISELAAATVGAMPSRGDVVSVFVQAHPSDPAKLAAVTPPSQPTEGLAVLPSLRSTDKMESQAVPQTLGYQVIAVLASIAALVLAVVAYRALRQRREPLTAVARAAYIQRIKKLLAEEEEARANVA